MKKRVVLGGRYLVEHRRVRRFTLEENTQVIPQRYGDNREVGTASSRRTMAAAT